jgi:molecular chaperone DnaK (HSP70)
LPSIFIFTGQVNKAVIAVPAKFSPEQRAATGEAFKAAGLKVPFEDRLLP